jgi:outer membrane protein OmpA-like peptidoglycan-associated protein
MVTAIRIAVLALLILGTPTYAHAGETAETDAGEAPSPAETSETAPVATLPEACAGGEHHTRACRCGTAVITVSDETPVWWGNRGRAYGPYLTFDRARLPDPPAPRPAFAPVYFELDRSEIREAESAKLRRVLRYLRARPNAQVRVEGNCCDLAPNAYNQRLGMRRADAVKGWLVERGVAPERVTTVTHGEEQLVTEDPAKRPLNRRADIIAEPRR